MLPFNRPQCSIHEAGHAVMAYWENIPGLLLVLVPFEMIKFRWKERHEEPVLMRGIVPFFGMPKLDNPDDLKVSPHLPNLARKLVRFDLAGIVAEEILCAEPFYEGAGNDMDEARLQLKTLCSYLNERNMFDIEDELETEMKLANEILIKKPCRKAILELATALEEVEALSLNSIIEILEPILKRPYEPKNYFL